MPATTLHSSAGALRAVHDPVQGEAAGRLGAAIVCHPHPLHGGSMDNKVVYTVAKTLAAHGLHVLRFNFRGANGSEGVHDDGRGERDDVLAALEAAAALLDGPERQLLVAGYSFGAFVGLTSAADDPRVGALLAIAPPVNAYDFGPVTATERPLTVVYARDDELVPAAEVEAWISGCVRPPRVRAVDGAGHLFHARLPAIREAAAAVLEDA